MSDWLVADVSPHDTATPETLTDEQRLVGRTAADFLQNEVVPATDLLESKDWAKARALLARCGELGLLGVDVPEEYGGVALDKTSAVIVTEALGPAASFSVTFGGQTNLAITPIVWFGSDAQKRTYLPRLTSGEMVGAYALSESGSGSDALAARARATRQPDGSWRLTGEKLWITNGGFADLFIVFAKVDGTQFSAFLVERGFAGVSTGSEEHKMGLHGSSTTPLILQEAAVPAAQLLGEIGKGHKIAFNVLNYGRLKLAAMCSGCAKAAIAEAARYAASRRQFDQPIARFGAIQHKLGEMTIREFAVESMLYRTAGFIDSALQDESRGAAAAAAVFERFAVEASLLKVAGSEMLDFVLDENVQIHGGNGFVRDYPAERRYRDGRVNRIFEGTNEINRLLVPAMLIKRAGDRGGWTGEGRRAEVDTHTAPGDLRSVTRSRVRQLKTLARRVLGLIGDRDAERLRDEQEVGMLASDIVRDAFAAESALLRAETVGDSSLHLDAAAVIAYDAATRSAGKARLVLARMETGDTVEITDSALDTITPRRRVADAVVARGGYIFS